MSLFQNAYGNFLSSSLPYYQSLPGIMTPYGTLLKPGGRVAAYVRSTGAQDGEDHFASSGMLVSTLQAGLARCRSGQNDIVYVLPGHTENISSADFMTNLVAGTQIIGVGRPGATNNPELVWTVAGGTFLLDVANVTLMGMNLKFTGANTIAAPITVSAAGCSIVGNRMDLGSGASNDCQVAVTVASGADDCLIANNHFSPSGAQNANVQVILIGAVARCQVLGNYISSTLTATTNGLIHIGAAATDLNIGRNLLWNGIADGIGIRVADTFAATGVIWENYIALNGTTATAISKGVSFEGTTEAVQLLLFENYCSDESTKAGVIVGSAVAT